MKTVSDILNNVPIQKTAGNMNQTVPNIHFDSRKVEAGDLFVATVGVHADGHNYIDQVVEKGAKTIVCQVLPETLVDGVTYVQTTDSAYALGQIAANYYDNPSKKLNLVAVTGTNGKTSVVTLLHKLFIELGYHTGMLSTVVNKINDEAIPSTHTTPDAIGLNQLLSKMVQAGCTHCFIEASSHAIDQKRIAGLHLSGAAFMNISHDHLDYHHTFDAYIKAKKALFDHLPKTAFALLNADDKRGTVMAQNTKAKVKYFGLKTLADVKGKIIENSLEGLELEIDKRNVWFQLVGEFNAYNLLAVYGIACELGENEEEVLTALSTLESAPGRFERVISSSNIIGIVDYAHTPDALENVLKTISDLRQGSNKIITVVGCGGDRDSEKRPKMAAIACNYSDQTILTSDNPRSEDPEEILNQMQKGVGISQQRKCLRISDRREAIKLAITLANTGDIVLVAGKGHETYQEVKGVKTHFDDKEELNEHFKLLGK